MQSHSSMIAQPQAQNTMDQTLKEIWQDCIRPDMEKYEEINKALKANLVKAKSIFDSEKFYDSVYNSDRATIDNLSLVYNNIRTIALHSDMGIGSGFFDIISSIEFRINDMFNNQSRDNNFKGYIHNSANNLREKHLALEVKTLTIISDAKSQCLKEHFSEMVPSSNMRSCVIS